MPEWTDPAIFDFLEINLGGMISVIGLVLGWRGFNYLRRNWLEWRWQRRIARDPMVFRDEQRDYQLAMHRAEDNPESKSIAEILLEATGQIVLVGAMIVVADNLDWDLGLVALVGAPAVGLAIWLWKKVHDPPSREMPDLQDRKAKVITIPTEAIAALAAAICVIGLFFLFASSI